MNLVQADQRNLMSKSDIPTKFPTSMRRRKQKKRYFFDRFKKRIRFSILLLIVLLVGGNYPKLKEICLREFYSASSYLGFTVDTVLISGCNRVKKMDILNTISLKKGTNIFLVHPSELANEVKQLTWVSAVYVRRRLPSTIELIIQEHEPLALWHNEGKAYLISKIGDHIRDVDLKKFKHLPSIVGKKAGDGAQHLLAVLSDYKDLYLRFKYATFVGGRRWDLTFENGVVVRLPEEKFENSINYLQNLQENTKILNRNVEIVDLRFEKKLILRKPKTVKLPGYNQAQGV